MFHTLQNLPTVSEGKQINREIKKNKIIRKHKVQMSLRTYCNTGVRSKIISEVTVRQ